MPSEHRFRDDGTKATRFYKPDDSDDQMNEKDEDVVPAGIVSKPQKRPGLRPILYSPPTGPPTLATEINVQSRYPEGILTP